MVDKIKAEKAIEMFLEAIGEDLNREGIKDTPKRVAKMYEELTSGYSLNAKEPLSKVFSVNHSDLVLVKDINFHSLCEHHLLPFMGNVHIAYIPNTQVVGLSKLARTVEIYARRLQLQEQLTNQIADSIYEYLKPKGVFVVVSAEHTCMTMRGIKKVGSKTLSYSSKGVFKDNYQLQKNVLDLINNG
ncbi:MAG: GTP cyclohydrolase I FolE [Spirochaetia bacterium]|nr:GTP cyclohydrolase I FolE [Spirochaetia bacterium]